MPTYSMIFGVILSALGAVAYFQPDLLGTGKDGKLAEPGHGSALSPVGVGALLLLAGAVSLAAPKMRKHAMHLAAVVSLLGTISGFVPVILRNFAIGEVAVKVGLGMSLLSGLFLILCIKSFRDVRIARQRAEQGA